MFVLQLIFPHYCYCLVTKIVSNSLQPHELQHARLPCPSPSPGVCSSSCSLSQWCHPTISSSVVPFSSCLQSFPASGSFPMSQFFPLGSQSIGASASASVLPMNIPHYWRKPFWVLYGPCVMRSSSLTLGSTIPTFCECWALLPPILPSGSFHSPSSLPHTNVLISTPYLRRALCRSFVSWSPVSWKQLFYICCQICVLIVLGRRVILVLVSPSWSEVEMFLIIYLLNIYKVLWK